VVGGRIWALPWIGDKEDTRDPLRTPFERFPELGEFWTRLEGWSATGSVGEEMGDLFSDVKFFLCFLVTFHFDRVATV